MAQISPRLIKWDLEIRSPHIDSSEDTWMNKDMNEDFDGKVSPSSVKHVTNFHHNCHWLLLRLKFKRSLNKNISQALSLPSWIHHIIQTLSITVFLFVDLTLSAPWEQVSYTHGAIQQNRGHIWCCPGLLWAFSEMLCCPMVLSESGCCKRHG